MTRDEAWEKAIADAMAHARKSALKDKSAQEHLAVLIAGFRDIGEQLAKNRLRTNSLNQLIACAIDCLGAAIYEADQRGEKPTYPPGST